LSSAPSAAAPPSHLTVAPPARVVEARRHWRLWQGALGAGALLAVGLFAVYSWMTFRIVERPAWPPAADAVTAEQAQARAEAFAARPRPRRDDVALPYAASAAAHARFFADGRAFFPAILQDLERATVSIHIIQFGFLPGMIADRFVSVLERKAREGIAVRVVVDAFGSDVYDGSRRMFERMARAGVQIVVNHAFPPDRDGLFPGERIDWRGDEIGRVDHRKMYVIDGAIGWVGGAGIEDDFVDDRFRDVFVRVEGAVVRQMQAVFLTSFRALGGPLASAPGALARDFPAPPAGGTISTTLLQNVPGGFLAGTQAIRDAVERARSRLDVLTPYLSDPSVLDQLVAAAERGVAVRLIVSERATNRPAHSALRQSFGRLLASGVRIWEYPAVMHAKVIVADDVTIIGTINPDSFGLYRNPEIALRFESRQVADEARAQLAEDSIRRSRQGREPADRWDRVRNWVMSRLTYFF
jgi:cardiolipin synthase A/B